MAIVEFLITNGVNLEITDEWGYTALHIACYNKHLAIAEFLIRNGANLDAINNYGKTPFNLIDNEELKERLKKIVPDEIEKFVKPAKH